MLIDAHDNYKGNWMQIAKHVPAKFSVQDCKKRIKLLLSQQPKDKLVTTTAEWTPQEDSLFNELHKRYGSNWEALAKHFPGRSIAKVKAKCNMNNKVHFSAQEDHKLAVLFEQHPFDWQTISSYFPYKHAAIVKERFFILKN